MQAPEDAAIRSESICAGDFYAALANFPASSEAIHFCDLFTIRPISPIDNDSDILNCVLNVKRECSDSVMHIPFSQLTHELVISGEWTKTIDAAADIAALVARLLRMRTQAPFFVASVVDCAWDTIARQERRSVSARRVDRTPAYVLQNPVRVEPFGLADAEWMTRSFERVVKVGNADDRYKFALECLNFADFDQDPRMSATRLWGGIEALFDVSQEIRFRLSAIIASLIYPAGEDRITAYDEVKKLYDDRSRIVHGRGIARGVLEVHVRRVRKLLCDCLIQLTELGYVPTIRELEQLMLGCSPIKPR